VSARRKPSAKKHLQMRFDLLDELILGRLEIDLAELIAKRLEQKSARSLQLIFQENHLESKAARIG